MPICFPKQLPPEKPVFAVGKRDWVAAWGASPEMGIESEPNFSGRSVRLIVRPTLGGDQIKVRISNLFGTGPLLIGAARVGFDAAKAAVAPGSKQVLTFSCATSVAIPVGAAAVSDPGVFAVPADVDLAVSIFVQLSSGPATLHGLGLQTSFASGVGDFTANEDGKPFEEMIRCWPFLVGLDVRANEGAHSVVILGDSVTDGVQSTPDTNSRWSDFLSRRFLASGRNVAVVNEGISGNRLLFDALRDTPHKGRSGLARFDLDVIKQTKASHVIVLLGINDIGAASGYNAPAQLVDAEEIIAGYQRLVSRAHEVGLKIVVGTLMPFEFDTSDPPGYFSDENEQKRQAVNLWVRTSGELDGVIDFDAVMRDPSRPSRILPEWDSGDHLHPNDAGYNPMADAIALSIFD